MKAEAVKEFVVKWDDDAVLVERGEVLEGERAEWAVRNGLAREVRDAGPSPDNRAVPGAPRNRAGGR